MCRRDTPITRHKIIRLKHNVRTISRDFFYSHQDLGRGRMAVCDETKWIRQNDVREFALTAAEFLSRYRIYHVVSSEISNQNNQTLSRKYEDTYGEGSPFFSITNFCDWAVFSSDPASSSLFSFSYSFSSSSSSSSASASASEEAIFSLSGAAAETWRAVSESRRLNKRGRDSSASRLSSEWRLVRDPSSFNCCSGYHKQPIKNCQIKSQLWLPPVRCCWLRTTCRAKHSKRNLRESRTMLNSLLRTLNVYSRFRNSRYSLTSPNANVPTTKPHQFSINHRL